MSVSLRPFFPVFAVFPYAPCHPLPQVTEHLEEHVFSEGIGEKIMNKMIKVWARGRGWVGGWVGLCLSGGGARGWGWGSWCGQGVWVRLRVRLYSGSWCGGSG